MKKAIAVALLSAFIAAPAFAADTSAKTDAKSSATNTAPAKASAQNRARKIPLDKTECAAEHRMTGYGMMGGHGPGMMGGYGAGMMGGYNADMMLQPDMHLYSTLALSEEQQAKITKLADELKHNNWATQGLLNDETAKLRDLYHADKRDPVAIGSAYQKVFDLKRQLIVTYLEAENHIEEVLTPEQRAQLKDARNKMRGMYGHP